MLKLFISEIILRYIYYIFWIVWYKVKSKTTKDFDWRQEYELSDEFVWLTVLYCEVWMCMFMYPVMAFVGTVTIYLHSRYLIYRLQYQKKQPLMASNDMSTGSLMNMYVTITFCIAFSYLCTLIFLTTPRFKYWNMTSNVIDLTKNCGPFESNNELSPIEEVGVISQGDTLANRILMSILLQLTLYLLLFMIGSNSKSQIKVLNEVKRIKFQEYELKIRQLSEKLNKLDIKEKYLRQKRYNE